MKTVKTMKLNSSKYIDGKNNSIDCEMIYNDSNNVITCMSKQYPNLTFEYKFNPNWDLDYNFSVVKELFINHWQDYIHLKTLDK